MQAALSQDQWVELEGQVTAWEGAARAALEATCGHYTRNEHLLPFLKLRPRGVQAPRSRQRACVAVAARMAADHPTPHAGARGAIPADGTSAGGVAQASTRSTPESECAQPGVREPAAEVASGDREGLVGHGEALPSTRGGVDGGEVGCKGDAAARAHMRGRGEATGVAVRVVASVRVFLVAQEAVGRLPGRVWVRLDPGAAPAARDAALWIGATPASIS